jgi:RNA polymerase sigma factor (sigma-70 family)
MAMASAILQILGTGLESDSALLARYIGTRDEAAFTALYRRHGPMVRAICRRYCSDTHIAEEAEQGVWMVLARKAAFVSRPDRLANWLFGVAIRVARKAADAANRKEIPSMPIGSARDTSASIMAIELLRVLDEELAALPENERLPVVLCYLEGQTQDEAARVCGTCVRTIRRRLNRGREALRRRLERRGIAPAAGFAAIAVASDAVGAVTSLPQVAHACSSIPSSLPPCLLEGFAVRNMTWAQAIAFASLGLVASAAVAAVLIGEVRAIPAAGAKVAVPIQGTVPAALPKGVIARHAWTEDPQSKSAKRDAISNPVAATDNPDAKAVLEKAGKTADQIADPSMRAYALMYIARAQSKAGDRAGAVLTFEQSILAAEAIQHGDGSIKGQALMYIVNAQAEAGHVDAALETSSRIQTKGRNCKEWALAHIASAQARAKNIKGAMETVESMPDNGKSLALMLISCRQAEAGDLKEALKTAEQISDGLNKVEAFTIVAKAQARAGDKAATEKSLEFALETVKGLEGGDGNLDISRKAHGLTLIAAAWAQTGYLKNAMNIADSLKGWHKEQEVLASVAKALIEAGKIPEALQIVEKLQDVGIKGDVLLGVVKNHIEKRDLKAARKTTDSIEQDVAKIDPLLELAKAQAKSGDLAAAKAACQEAVDKLKNPDTVWYSNGAMSAAPDYLHRIMSVRSEVGDEKGAIDWAYGQDSPFIKTLVLAAVAEGLVKRKER